MQHIKLFFLLFILIGFSTACKKDKPTKSNTTVKPTVKVPAFDGGGAYDYVAKQVAFGPRVPGTATHVACKDWLVSEFESLGATTQIQEFKANFFEVKNAASYNIIASINPKARKRVLIAAHWDSRLVADKDDKDQKKPIDGADDGGSGVGVILQLAKTIKDNPINMGVDFILFDAEDNGQEGESFEETSWCQGSKYWSLQKHDKNYRADFGILLDMVGAKNARFPLEGISRHFAKNLQDKIWTLAGRMGYGDLFQKVPHGQITDDHYFVNQTGIKMVDIINLPGAPGGEEDSFGHYHHTHEDNMDNIDKEVLRKVGQVVTAVLYKSSDGSF